MKEKTSHFLHFFYPRYWFIKVGLSFLWLLSNLPYRAQLYLGKKLGLILFHTKMRHTAEVNLKLCFPELSEKERYVLLKKNFISVGIGVFETGLSWWGSANKLKFLVHYHGEENLRNAVEERSGFLLLGAHFTTLELIGKLVALEYDLVIVYRAHKKPWINNIITKILKNNYVQIIERSNVRALLKALKKGKVVWYPPDIDAGYYDHVFVPFFGVSAASLTATARLAQFTKAKILPVSFYRRDDKTGYDVYISSPLEHFPTGDMKRDTAYINEILETAIRKKPEQYIWQYKRFKTRPNNESRFY